ncbi:MAG: hypothetical protein B7W95_01295, partial [Acidimicrobiales bacterium 20-64-4]
PEVKGAKDLSKGTLPSCGANYLLSAANLAITPNNSAQGYSINSAIGVDPSFSHVATTAPAEDVASHYVILPEVGQGATRYLLGPSELSGTYISKAYATIDATGAWAVQYTLTGAGSKLWDQVAQANFHQYLAIELDGVIQSAPLIQPNQTTFTSFGGQGQISGNFTQQSAQALAVAMQFGALPVRLLPLTTQAVSATLGHSDLIAALGAGLAGLALVMLYVMFYYRLLGLVIFRRGEIGAQSSHLGRPRVQVGLAHGARRGHGLPARRHLALPGGGRGRAGLRLLPRTLDADGHLLHLVLHPAARHLARASSGSERVEIVDGRGSRSGECS